MNRSTVFALAALCLLDAIAMAAVPTSMTVQGRLTDALGNPLAAGSKDFTFRIFDDTLGGLQVWPPAGVEFQSINSDASGLWTTLVGKISPLSAPVFASEFRWLEVNVNGVLLPRVRLVTGPYAFRVATVDAASGGTITSKVAIGIGHDNSGTDAFVAGINNNVTGLVASVTGGNDNTASGAYSHVGGGEENLATEFAATIAGGSDNDALAYYAGVGGGLGNVASDTASFVGGGFVNIASGNRSVVAGGGQNVAQGDFSFVGGGANNTASAVSSVVGGGGVNKASGLGATVPGGFCNSADGASSFAAGEAAKANHNASFVWNGATSCADSFSTTAVNQFLIRASGGVGVGTNAPEAPLHLLEGSAGATTAHSNSVAVFERNNNAYLQLLTPDANESGLLFGTPIADIGGGVIFNSTAVPNGLEFRTNTNDFAISIDAAGHVGIGESAPDATLDVDGGAIVGGMLDVSTTVGALIVPRLTTAQRTALTAVNGMIIYNTSTNQFNFHENGVWVTK